MNTGTRMGEVEDSYGRRIEVWLDRSGAVKLGLGLTDLMLPRGDWEDLAALGAQALRLAGPCGKCGAEAGVPCAGPGPVEGRRHA